MALHFPKKGAPRFEPGTSQSADECSTSELYPASANLCFALRRNGYEKALSRNIQNRTDHFPAFEILRKKNCSSLPRRRGHQGLNQGPLNLQTNALPVSYTPASANLCFALRRNGYEKALSRNIQNRTDHFPAFEILRKKKLLFTSPKKGAPRFEPGTSQSADECSTRQIIFPPSKFSEKNCSSLPRRRGHQGLNQGPLNLQTNALPVSYTPASANLCFALRRNGYEKALSRNIQNRTDHFPAFEILRKNCSSLPRRRGHQGLNQGPLNLQTNALPVSYTPASANLCFALRRNGYEKALSRNIQNRTDHFPAFEILRKNCSSLPRRRGHQGLNQGPLNLQTNALPVSYTPASANLCFALRRNGYEKALSRNIQNRTDHFPAFEILRKKLLFTSRRRGHQGLNQGPLNLQTNALPVSYTPRQRTFALRYVGTDTKRPCLEIYRIGQIIFPPSKFSEKIALHFPEEGGTKDRSFSRLRNSQKKKLLFTSPKKGHQGLNQGPLNLQTNALPVSYTPASANLCFALRRNGYEKALSRNIQNRTDHFPAFEILRKNCSSLPRRRGHQGLNQGPLNLQTNALPVSYTPASANLCFALRRNGYEKALSRNIQNRTDHFPAFEILRKNCSSLPRRRGHQGLNQGPLNLQTNALPVSYTPASANLCFALRRNGYEKALSRNIQNRTDHFPAFEILRKKLLFTSPKKGAPRFEPGTSQSADECSTRQIIFPPSKFSEKKIAYSLPRRRRHRGLNQGPLNLQTNALPVSYTPASANLCFALRRNGYEKALSRNIQNRTDHFPAFEILRKNCSSLPRRRGHQGLNQGPLNLQTNALPDRSFSRLRNSQKKIALHFPEEGAPRFEPGTSQSADECSTSELYPRQRTFALRYVGTDTKRPCLEIYRIGQIIFPPSKFSEKNCSSLPEEGGTKTNALPVSYTPASANLCFALRRNGYEKALSRNIQNRTDHFPAFEILRKNCSSLPRRRGHQGLNQGPLNLQTNALPVSYTPASANLCFALRRNGYEKALSRNIQNRTDHFPAFEILRKNCSSLPRRRGHQGLNQGPLNLQTNALPVSYTPASANLCFALRRNGYEKALSRNIQNRTDHFPAFEILRKNCSSLPRRRGHQGLNQGPLNLQTNALPVSYTPASANLCFALRRNGYEKALSRNIQNRTDHFPAFEILRKNCSSLPRRRGHQGLNQGPLNLQTNALPVSYTPASANLCFALRRNGYEKALSRNIQNRTDHFPAFEILRKNCSSLPRRRGHQGLNQGPLNLQTNALPVSYTPASANLCFALRRNGYEKALSRNIQNRTDHFPAFEILRKKLLFTSPKKGAPRNGYEKALSRNIQNRTDHFPAFEILRKNCSSLPRRRGHQGLNQGPLNLQTNALPVSYTPASANLCFALRRNGYEKALSRNIQNRTDHFPAFEILRKNCSSLPRRRGHQGLNQGPLNLQTNALPVSYTPASANLCFALRRNGYEKALSRNIQNRTDHFPAFEILRKNCSSLPRRRGHQGLNQGPLNLQTNALPVSYTPASANLCFALRRNGYEKALSRNIQNRTDHFPAFEILRKNCSSLPRRRGHQGLNQGPLNLQTNALPVSYTPASANLCFALRRNGYEKALSRNIQNRTDHFPAFEILRKNCSSLPRRRGHQGLNQGPLNLQTNALPVSYTPASANLCFALRRNGYEKALSRNIQNRTDHFPAFEILRKNCSSLPRRRGHQGLNQGPLNLQTNALPVSYTPASANLALRYVGTDTKRPCLEIYRIGQIIFPPSKFSEKLLFTSPKKGAPRFEPGTSQSADECSTRTDTKRPCLEIYRIGQIIFPPSKFSEKKNCSSLPRRRGHQGLNQGPLNLQTNALPVSYTPASANLCFALRRNGYEKALSRNIQNRTDHFPAFEILRKNCSSLPRRRGHQGLNQGPLNLQTNALPVSYTPASANLCFALRRNGYEKALSRNIQNRTDHFPAFEILRKKNCSSLPRRRGHQGLNQGPLNLQTNALPVSYTPRQRTVALRYVGTDTKRPCREIYRIGQIIFPPSKFSEKIALHFPEEGGTKTNALPVSYTPASANLCFALRRNGYEKALSRNIQNRTDHFPAFEILRKNCSSLPRRRGHQGLNQGPLNLQTNALPVSYTPASANLCFALRRNGYEKALSRNIQNRTDHFPAFEILRKNCSSLPRRRGHQGLNQGPLNLQTNALPVSYTPRQRTFALRYVGTDTKRPCLEIYRIGQIIFPPSKFSEKIALHFPEEGAPRFEPGTSQSADECSTSELYPASANLCFALRRNGYEKALSRNIQNRTDHFPAFEILRKKLLFTSPKKGAPRFEPGTSQSADECSTRTDTKRPCLEIYRIGQIIFPPSKFSEKIALHFPEEGAPRFEPGTSQSADECSTSELYPASANLCFALRRNGYEKALSRNIQNRTDHFPAFEILRKNCSSLPRRRGHQGLNQGPLNLQTNALPVSYTPASANLCFALRRNGYEKALSRNIQNRTDHFPAFEILRKNCSSLPRRRGHQGTDTKRPCLEIYRIGQIIFPPSKFSEKIALHFPEEGAPRFEPGTSQSADECSTSELYPASANLCFALRRNGYEKALSRNIQNRTDHFPAFEILRKNCSSLPRRRGHQGLNQGPLNLQTNALPVSYTPASANLCFALRRNGYEKALSRNIQNRTDHFPAFEILRKNCSSLPRRRGHQGLNQGPLNLQTNALPVSYTPASANLCFALRRNGYEKALSRNIQNRTDHFPAFEILRKKNALHFPEEGGTKDRSFSRLRNSQKKLLFTSPKKGHQGLNQGPLNLQTNALPVSYTPASANLCFALRRNGYEKALSRNIQNRTDHFPAFEILRKKLLFTSPKKGAPRFEPGTSQSADECSTSELYTASANLCFALRRNGYEKALSRNIQNRTDHFPAFEILRKNCSSLPRRRGHQGLNQGPLNLQTNALPVSYTPASANLCFALRRNGYEKALSRNIQNRTDHFPAFEILRKNCSSLPRRRGHQGLNQGPLNLQTNVLPVSYTPASANLALRYVGTDTKRPCLEIYRIGQIIFPPSKFSEKIALHFPEEGGTKTNALPVSYTPASANLCFALRRNGYENALSRNIQNRTDHFPAFEILRKKLLFTSPKKGAPRFEPGTSQSADECSTSELYPASANLCFALRRNGYEKALSRNIQNRTDHFPAFEILRKNCSSLPRRRGHQGLNQGPLNLQTNALPVSYTPASANLCFALRRNGYEKALSRNIQNRTDHFPAFEILRKKLLFTSPKKGAPRFEPGTSQSADECSTRTDTKRPCLEIYRIGQIIFPPSKFSEKIALHFPEEGAPRFEPGTSQSADECSTRQIIFRLRNYQKKIALHFREEGAPRFEPGTSQSADECSTRTDTKMPCLEIYRIGQIIFPPSKFSEKKEGGTKVALHFPKKGHQGLNQGPLNLRTNALPVSYTPASANLCFALRRNGYEKALSRNIQNRTDHFPAFEILRKKNFSSLPRRRGHQGLNQGPLNLQTNALPVSYTPASANLCFALRRNGYEKALSRNIQNRTDHFPAFEILRKKLLFTSPKKGAPRFEPGTSQSADECSTSELYPASANLCFALRRNGYEKALSRNIQNRTDHFPAFEILRKKIALHFPEEGGTKV
ncbi:hypothetical protein TNCV_4664821 [Trichonephila clavipes]|uniref:Uncharacterized protein n=1 Tax=Trichonephila clavipes TaxID=2585209 RepID=A0A8X6VBN1_TRICX|nr:hypothetical protein TNCV_4664821 [Trichonephila clavipes]